MSCILVIEDNDNFRLLLRLQLESAGYEVREARNGTEGLQRYGEQPVDVVVCDLFMPEKEGLETIRELRQAGEAKIIAISGDGLDATSFLRVALHFGAARALSKPFESSELLTAIGEVLSANGSES